MASNHRVDRPTGGSAANPASVVVADPNPLSLLTLAGILHAQGHHVTCARTASAVTQALESAVQEVIVWEVADDATAALSCLADVRSAARYRDLPAVLIADARWAGLEKKTEALAAATRCLFKPIDPQALVAVVDQILWMPALLAGHRRRGTRPTRPGWIEL